MDDQMRQDEDCNESEMRIFISLVSDWTRRKIQCNIPTILKSITNKKSHYTLFFLQNFRDSITMEKKENPMSSNENTQPQSISSIFIRFSLLHVLKT